MVSSSTKQKLVEITLRNKKLSEDILKCISNAMKARADIPDKAEMEQKCSLQMELPATISSSYYHIII